MVNLDGSHPEDLRMFEAMELVGTLYDPQKVVAAVENFKSALRGDEPMSHYTPAENDKIIAAGYEPENRPAELKKTRTSDPQFMALLLVQKHYYPELPLSEIYVVWFCSTLRNWKCLISTNVKDNHYYEVTHNGSISPAETYIDQYTKTGHTSVQGDEIVHAELPKL